MGELAYERVPSAKMKVDCLFMCIVSAALAKAEIAAERDLRSMKTVLESITGVYSQSSNWRLWPRAK